MPPRINSNKTTQQTATDIKACVNLWNRDASEMVISAWDMPPPLTIGGKDALLRCLLRGAEVKFQCSAQPTYALNLRACYLALDGMRLNEKRGIGDVMREAYAQLPAPKATAGPYAVLGVSPTESMPNIEAAYRRLAQEKHPDHPSGSQQAMTELNAAFDAIKQERLIKA